MHNYRLGALPDTNAERHVEQVSKASSHTPSSHITPEAAQAAAAAGMPGGAHTHRDPNAWAWT